MHRIYVHPNIDGVGFEAMRFGRSDQPIALGSSCVGTNPLLSAAKITGNRHWITIGDLTICFVRDFSLTIKNRFHEVRDFFSPKRSHRDSEVETIVKMRILPFARGLESPAGQVLAIC